MRSGKASEVWRSQQKGSLVCLLQRGNVLQGDDEHAPSKKLSCKELLLRVFLKLRVFLNKFDKAGLNQNHFINSHRKKSAQGNFMNQKTKKHKNLYVSRKAKCARNMSPF